MIGRWSTPRVEEQGEKQGFDAFELRLGDVMRGERATLGKSLLDVQRELKIKATYIAAIENCDPSAFDTPSFIAGYVRSYARYLGMDPELAFRTFCTESGFKPAHGLSPEASSPRPEKRQPQKVEDALANPNATFVPRRESLFAGLEPGAIGSVAALLALVGVIGYGGMTVLKQIQQVDFAPVEESAGVIDDLPDFAGQTGIVTAEGTGATGLTQPPSMDAMDRLYRPQALEVPVLVARDGPISTLDPREVGMMAQAQNRSAMASVDAPAAAPTMDDAISQTIASVLGEGAAPEAPVTAQNAVQVFGPGAPEVAIFAVRPSWVRVSSADGSVLLEKILEAGERFVLPATEAAPVLRAGNAGSVYFAVNGTAHGPAGSGPSVVKDVPLSADALSSTYAVADLSQDADLASFVAVAQVEGGVQ